MPYSQVAKVALLQSIGQTLDYALDPASCVPVGSLVQVPLRKGRAKGIIVELKSKSEFTALKPIGSVLEMGAIGPNLLRLAQWMAAYYCCRLDQILKCMLPKNVREATKAHAPLVIARKKTKKFLRQWCEEHRGRVPKQAAVIDLLLQARGSYLAAQLQKEINVTRAPIEALVQKQLITVSPLVSSGQSAEEHEYFATKPKVLSKEQARALEAITGAAKNAQGTEHLLHGVTGSGKTEVYLQAIAHTLELGKKVLILIPEISLTPQTVERFKSRFAQKLAIVHSRIRPAEKSRLWKEMGAGAIDVVIGARSAIFSPLHPLGLIIIDEEHEASYKSEQLPYYHARDVLRQRAKIECATLVLASATPSLESYKRAIHGKSTLLELRSRAASALMPEIRLINSQNERERAGGAALLSVSLLAAVKQCATRGEQALLFLNRRGYRSGLLCKQCQQCAQCPNCDVSLTFHLETRALICHFCGKSQNLLQRCPQCGGADLTFRGWGTQHVEIALKRHFPGLRVLRADRDTTEHEGELERLLHAFGTGKADVLVGTQMIGKGHHFPAVTLVGVLNPDHGLHIPDFRASELLFQTITQVAGRSGRAGLAGRVLVQTAHPDHPLYQLALQGNYRTFFEQECAARELFHYPPNRHLIKCLMRGDEQTPTKQAMDCFYQQVAATLPSQVLLSSPIPSPRTRLQSAYRYQFLLKTERVLPVARAVFDITQNLKLPKGVHLSIDVDPLNLA